LLVGKSVTRVILSMIDLLDNILKEDLKEESNKENLEILIRDLKWWHKN